MYTASSEDSALEGLAEFAARPWADKYPDTLDAWQRAQERFAPFLAFPPMLRRVVYTTNAIESLNYQLRKITKNRGHFPNETTPSSSCGSRSATSKTAEPPNAPRPPQPGPSADPPPASSKAP
nr:transposase [Schaalia hyovaginalis]